MEIIVSKDELSKGVNIVNKAVPSRTTMAILECILFEATNGEIKLTANDMEMGIETSIDGEIRDNGIVAIDAKMLTELVKKLPDNDVSIKTENTIAHIKCGKVKADIPMRSGENYPGIPTVEKDNVVTISQFSLREIIRQTIFSTSENDANKMMSGELFDISGNKLRVTALDGHRIAIRTVELRDSFDDKKAVIPAKTLNEISRVIPGGINEDVNIFFTNNHALFEFDRTTVVTRLVDGDYFATDKMTDMDFGTRVTINRKDFLESIDRSTLFLSATDKKPVIMDISDNTLEWSVKTTSGAMSEDLEVVKTGEDMKIGFNPRFMIDALKVIDDEEVTLHLINPKMPCAIKDEKGSYLYLVLPVNFA